MPGTANIAWFTGPPPPPYVQITTFGSIVNNNSYNVNFNIAPTNGNLLLLIATCDSTINIPSGWNRDVTLVSNAETSIYSRISNGTEQSIAVSITATTSFSAVAIEINGFSTFDKSNTASTSAGSSTIATGTTATTTAANEIVLVVAGMSDPSNSPVGPVTGWTNNFVNYAYAYAHHSTGGTAVETSVGILLVNATSAYTSTATLTLPTQSLSLCNGMIGTYK